MLKLVQNPALSASKSDEKFSSLFFCYKRGIRSACGGVAKSSAICEIAIVAAGRIGRGF